MNFDDIIEQMKVKYINDLAFKIKNLKTLVQEKDFINLESFFHKLKGSGLSYGFPEFSEYGAKYEQKAKDKILSDAEFKNLVPELETLYRKHI